MKRIHIKRTLRRMARSRVFVLSASLVLALLIVTGTTLAWLVSKDAKVNELGVTQYQFGTAPQQASVKNTGDIPAFVRAMVFPGLVAADGVTLLEMQLGEQATLEGLGNNWADGKDGYYYYLGRLAPGQITPAPLFEEIAPEQSVAERYPDAKLTIDLVVESIDGTGDYYRSAWWQNDQAPAAAPLLTVDTALQTILGGD